MTPNSKLVDDIQAVKFVKDSCRADNLDNYWDDCELYFFKMNEVRKRFESKSQVSKWLEWLGKLVGIVRE